MDNQKLSARVEALEGPDRKVDGDIARKIYGAGGDGLEGTTLYSKPGVMGWSHAPVYTASLDAAMSLVGQHDFWRVGHDGEGSDPSLFKAQVGVEREGECWHTFATAIAVEPALSLCAAALKARGL